jgi:S-formylglutathione hydrolase
MTFSVFVPPQADDGTALPVVWYLSGLTCTHANVTDKGEYRRACAELGLIFVVPDTSPRGEGVPDDPDGAYDFGLGAGFYVDATQAPFDRHYRMYSYLADELPEVVASVFPIDRDRQGITGHSMGGHGALTVALRNPDRFRSCSAYDAVALIEDGARLPDLLVDQGGADTFLAEQLRPELLADACRAAGIPLTLRMQQGYDHSYYFISTFMADHLAWHAERLRS